MKNLLRVFVVLLVALVPCKVPAQLALNTVHADESNSPTPVNYFKTKAVPAPAFPYNWSSTDLYQIWERLDSICTPSATVYTHYNWRNTDLYQIWLKLDSCFSGSAGDSTLPAWALSGNAGTNPAVEKLGTTDNADIRIVANDTQLVRIRTSGQIGITGAGKDTTLFDRSTVSLVPANVPNAIINRIGSVSISRTGFTGVPRSNTVFGIYAGDSLGYNNGYPVSNTLIGAAAGASIKGFNNPDAYAIGGYENFIAGAYSGMFGDTINGNVFVGAFSGQFSKTIANSVYEGLAAGRFSYHGFGEVCIGAHAGENFDSIPDGLRVNNTIVGGNAGLKYYTGQYTSLYGYEAGTALNSGNGNTVCGALSFWSATSGGNNTILGYFSGRALTNKNQSIMIGDLVGQFTDESLRLLVGTGAFCNNTREDSCFTLLVGKLGVDSSAQRLKANGMFGVNDGTQRKGKLFTAIDNNGYGHWNSNVDSTTSGDAITINSTVGSFVKDSTGTTFTLTNSFITTSSKIFYSFGTTGVTLDKIVPVPGSGSAVFTFEAAGVATAPNKTTIVNFQIIN